MNTQSQESGVGHSDVGTMNVLGLSDRAGWNFSAKIERFADDEAVSLGNSFKTTEFKKNILVNAGINLLESLLIGGAGTVYSNANAYIGVGDSATAADAAQTDLVAATNKLRIGMNATYPTQGSQVLTFQSDFGPTEANYAWNEFAVFNDASAGTMLNRKTSTEGTKTAGQTWRITITITIS